MSTHHLRRGARALTSSVAALAVAVALTAPGSAAPAEETITPGLYVVTFDDTPVATYAGGLRGYDATAPEPDGRFDNGRSAVAPYRARLERRQDRLLAGVGSPEPVYRYTTVVSGVAVELSSEQVRELRATDGVAAVERNTRARLDDLDSPSFLGLPGRAGAWARTGDAGTAGRGVVIGTIDSGLWPDNPSFAAPSLPDTGSVPGLTGFTGTCHRSERWIADDCNQKVVAARWFVDAFGADNIANAEYLSPRDAQGHGTHVASIAAGNADVQSTIEGQSLEETSGMAPGAAIATYKACWAAPNPEDDGCASADVLRALDQAVADGVDVVAYPLSGPADAGAAMQEAFRSATAAGVVVVTSAGNDGRSGVSASGPWVMTAGAATYRLFQGAAVLGDGRRLVGANMSEQAVPATPVVLAADIAAADADRTMAAQCLPGSLDAAAADGRVVVCQRGVGARVDKSRAVEQAGGVAMVLVNTARDGVEADFHSVPTVHLGAGAGAQLRRYVESAGRQARVAIDPAAEDDAEVPRLAGFSGRGPGADTDLVKPDLVAPGVSVLGAVAPTTGSARAWDVLSGTSMAAAHVAGLAALVRGEHPDWSPSAVKSAMMTSAYDVAAGPSGPLAQGAGHVDPGRFLDPGLVFDVRAADGARSPRRVNTPSIAVGDLVGSTVVRRTVTNVSSGADTYDATVSGLRGIDVTVEPATFALQPGESQTFRVRLVASGAARFDRFVDGYLTLQGSRGHTVRAPLAARARRVESDGEQRGRGSSGSLRVTGTGGMAGRVPVEVAGLAGADPEELDLTPGGAFDVRRPAAGPSTHRATFEVDDDAAAVRFEVGSAHAGADVDLYVFRHQRLVTHEASDAAREQVTLLDPPEGVYEVYAHLQDATSTASDAATFTGWVVPDEDTGTVQTPGSVPLRGGQDYSAEVSWSGLEPQRRWFGLVRVGESATPVSIG